MGKTETIIIVAIIIIILACLWWNSGTVAESFMTNGIKGPQMLISDNGTSNGVSNGALNGVLNGNDNENTNGGDNDNNGKCDNDEESDVVVDDKDELVLDDGVVTYDEFSKEADDVIRKKYMTRNHAKDGKYKHINYAQGKRGGSYSQAVDYIDESNDLLQTGYMANDQFVGMDDTKGQYAPYKAECKKVDKYKASEIFNSKNYLPNEKSINPEWWDIVPDAIDVKNRNLINVSKAIGIDTIGTSLRNPSYDIRGSPPCPKFVISPWLQSTIEPDTNLKSLC